MNKIMQFSRKIWHFATIYLSHSSPKFQPLEIFRFFSFSAEF